MSLVFSLCLFLSFGFLPSTLAGPQYTTFLSSQFSGLIAICARSCLEVFITTSFPTTTCADRYNINCLCTRESQTGFTLGEGAVRCIVSDCSTQQISDIAAAYGVCASIPGAKPMTHSTITATMANPTTIIFDTHNNLLTTETAVQSSSFSVRSIPSTIVASSTTSASNINTLSSTSSITGIPSTTGTPLPLPRNSVALFPSNSASTTATQSGSSSTSTISYASNRKSTLTTPQIAGIAVSAGTFAVAGFGLLIFLFYFKRRRSHKRDSGSSFGGDHILVANRGSPIVRAPNDRNMETGLHQRMVVSSKAQQFLGVPVGANDRGWSISRDRLQPQDIGVTVTPDVHREIALQASPASIASYRTTSRLLPEKPTYKLFPSPVQAGPSQSSNPRAAHFVAGAGRKVSLTSHPSTDLPQRSRRPLDTSRRAIQGPYDAQTQQTSDPFLYSPYDPRAKMYAMERRRASRTDLPQIVTSGNSWNDSSGQRLMRPQKALFLGARPSTSTSPQETARLQSIPQVTGPSVYSDLPSLTKFDPHTTSQSQFPAVAPHRSKGSARRPVTYYTTASDTSFEDEGDEVEEWPPHELGLSPVVESPSRRPPSNVVRYPPVPAPSPRAISESPTRKPPSKSSYGPRLAVSPLSPGWGRDKALPPRPGVLDRVELPERSSSLLESRREALRMTNRLNLPESNRVETYDLQKSAKWKILCSPGLEGLENVGSQSTSTMRHVKGDERTPNACS